MALSRNDQRVIYNQTNPDEPLSPDDPRNVDMDGENSLSPVRGVNVVRELEDIFSLSVDPACRLFSGLRGSGKSTELRRLADSLKKPDGAKLLPVLVDMEEYLDLAVPLSQTELLLALLFGAERKVLEAEGKDPGEAGQDGPFHRMWDWLVRTDVDLTKAEVGLNVPGAPSKLVLEMKTRPSVRQRVRNAVNTSPAMFFQEVSKQFIELEKRARERDYDRLLVIADSLEKMQGTSDNFAAVLSGAEHLFANGAPYLRLPVHVLYTVPPALLFRLSATNLSYLPMIKLRSVDGKENDDGYAAARNVLRKRVSEDKLLKELFGSDYEGALRLIIQSSGGYPRELVQLLHSMLLERPFPISLDRVKSALNRAGDNYTRLVHGNGVAAYEMLARVHVTKALSIPHNDDSLRALADRLMSANVVLRYRNDTEWYDVHPAVLRIKQVNDEIVRVRSSSKSSLSS